MLPTKRFRCIKMALKIFEIYNEEIKNEVLICPLKHPLIYYGWSEISIETEKLPIIGNISDKISESSKIYFKDVPIGFRDNNNNIVTNILLHESNMMKEPYTSIKNQLEEEIKAKGLSLEPFIDDLKDDDLYNNVLNYIFTKDKTPLNNTPYENIIENILSDLQENEDIVRTYPHLKFILNALKGS